MKPRDNRIPSPVSTRLTKLPIKNLLHQLTELRRKLLRYRVRDYYDYGEILVAKALGGHRNRTRVMRGHDVLAPGFNRVEVRTRTPPFSGKSETRVPMKASTRGHFDWLAVPIFRKDGEIKAAYLCLTMLPGL